MNLIEVPNFRVRAEVITSYGCQLWLYLQRNIFLLKIDFNSPDMVRVLHVLQYSFWIPVYFQFDVASKSWNGAEDSCKAYGERIHLASVQNVFENDLMLVLSNPGDYWIGLTQKEVNYVSIERRIVFL